MNVILNDSLEILRRKQEFNEFIVERYNGIVRLSKKLIMMI